MKKSKMGGGYCGVIMVSELSSEVNQPFGFLFFFLLIN